MTEKVARAIAVVGVGAVLPDAPNAAAFWENLASGKYSITEVDDDRWSSELYYDDDPATPDKTYSKIGGWVRDFEWAPLEWRLPIPPKVSDAMDRTQKYAISACREALLDYGYPERALDRDRTAVILGNAMGGDLHDFTSMRVYFPEFATELEEAPSFAELPEGVRQTIVDELKAGIQDRFPDITEDTMPGELGNIIAGRVANLFDFHGPNFVTDAACASAHAAIDAAIEGLEHGDYDAVLTGGIDSNMGPPSYIKFSKIGALSASGTRPYHEGADGFVMGEGGAVLLLRRLADAERDGDHIYAVIRGIGGSSDGKGKGITAPNPVGQEFAVARAWENAGIHPDSATYIEGHGTSTRVGDVVEVQAISKVFADLDLQANSIPLGSVKSNIGHLKSAAGAAGMLKTVLALEHKQIPPSLGTGGPNPNIDFGDSPLYITKELRDWEAADDQVRAAGVSSFGFGGTNFHLVLEEHIPGRLEVGDGNGSGTIKVPERTESALGAGMPPSPLRGALVRGAETVEALAEAVRKAIAAVAEGKVPEPAPPAETDLRAPHRIAIDYGDADELATRLDKALTALEQQNPAMWRALRNQGVFYGSGDPGLVAFLYTGQGSQYVNMLGSLRSVDPIVDATIADADAVMEPILGRPLSDFIYVDGDDSAAVEEATDQLRQTEITQPAVLTVDRALTEMLAAYGIRPDMVMGHSLGEYGALVASGALPFEDALEAVAGRGREMAKVDVPDKGLMAAVFAPVEEVQAVVDGTDDYVVVANLNSTGQSVIGGSTPGVEAAGAALTEAGHQVVPLPVSHAFHTEIVAPASEPLKVLLERLRLESPAIPLVANVDGEFYPMGPNAVPQMIDILGRQIASPVQFATGLRTLHDAGCRVFVEVGPKRALHGFAEDVLGDDPEVLALFTNHPKQGDAVSFNQALCGLYAAGLGVGTGEGASSARPPAVARAIQSPRRAEFSTPSSPAPVAATGDDTYARLGRIFADAISEGRDLLAASGAVPAGRAGLDEPAVVTGAGLALPGGVNVFGDDKIPSILHGHQFIDAVPVKLRHSITEKHVTRLVKSESGGGHFETIDSDADVIKLAGRGGTIDVAEDFGFPEARADVLDPASALAIGAGLDALRDAGIPLVMHYKDTTTGTKLPERWMLPEAYRDSTGVIFGSAFGGFENYTEQLNRFHRYEALNARRADLASLQERLTDLGHEELLAEELQHRLHEIDAELEAHPYEFDRGFLFRCVPFGHAQFAEYIGARGPNTMVNAACASTTQAVALAEDWIRSGRCDRVVVISGDNASSDTLFEWIGTGFLAVGAAATDGVVSDAALPFDRRRHGMIVGMGGAALVVERADSARTRGIQPIAKVLSTVTANSAFHGSRLDTDHIRFVMEDLISRAEDTWGIDRHQIAGQTVFISHETYTPARGGSAQAEIDALRHTFGDSADSIVISNTKGFTGHAMGAGVEDVVAVKAIETGIVPPVPNYKEPDPDLGPLNISKGGAYPVRYALRLGAGFGSQIALTLYEVVPSPLGVHPEVDELGYEYRRNSDVFDSWLRAVSGHDSATVEIERRTLRVRDDGAPAKAPAKPAARPRPEAVSVVGPAADAATSVGGAPDATTSVGPAADATTSVGPAADATAVSEGGPVASGGGPESVMPPAGAAEPPEAATESTDPVVTAVLGVVAEQTGYPAEMLDLDLDLEADLGIDTVKQAETFAAIREVYGIERDDSLALRDYPTLASVIGFVREKRPDLAVPSVGPAADATAVSEGGPVASGGGQETVMPAAGLAEPPVAATDEVTTAVLSVVADQTGYPAEMLDLDLDLEADLGIDTVKQAETFAAIREVYGIERDDSLALRDYPTLASVIGFVRERRPDLAVEQSTEAAVMPDAVPAAAAGQPPESTEAATESTDPVVAAVLGVVAEQTGYPAEMLDLDLDLEADLGIDTVKQAETFAAIREVYDIERDDSLALRDYPTLAHVIGFVREKRPDLAVPSVGPAADATAVSESGPAASVGGPETVMPAAGLAEPPEAATEDMTTPTEDPVVTAVLGVVADQTGYPAEMLDLDLDLEADLGIDTVKQAETFAAIREVYDIERDDSLALRDYPTLAHVIGFVREKRPDLAVPSVGPAADATAASGSGPDTSGGGQETVMPAAGLAEPPEAATEAVAVPRRIPVPMLRPSLDHCVATGVDLESARVIVAGDTGGLAAGFCEYLETVGTTVLTIDPTESAESVLASVDEFATPDGVDGVYWLPALDVAPTIGELDLDSWRAELNSRVKNLAEVMRSVYDQGDGSGPFLVSAVRLGGRHGYDEAGAVCPLGGAVTGFTKAYKRERPDALVKAVDFAEDAATDEIAAALVEETERDPGAVEIGRFDGRRFTIGLSEEPLAEEPAGLELGADSVVVVTGAAGGIVSAITSDLAAATGGGTFHLLDLVAEPDPDDADLDAFEADREGLKGVLFERLKEAGERATPAMIEKELAAIERLQAARSAIRAVEAAGGTVRYHSVNLLDGDAMAEVMASIADEHGKVDLLLHAGGLEISRLLPDKEQSQFDLVFDVKADGMFNLLSGLGDVPLGAVVVFSSVAGRFGNNGQTDYSSANDLLCKMVSNMRSSRPDTLGVAIDWTAWGDIGMATRGSIPTIMAAAGIDMLPAAVGIPIVRHEVTRRSVTGETVVAGRLGLMVDEYADAGGLDVSTVQADGNVLMTGVESFGIYSGFVATAEIDPTEQPFLDDHRIDGTAVLPGVMGVEAFAETASLALPDLHVAAVEDVTFAAPFKFYRDEPRRFRVEARFREDGDAVLADCRLVGERELATQAEPQVTVHFTGTVRLESEPPQFDDAPAPDATGEPVDPEAIYRIYFHGPAYQVLDGAWRAGDAVVGSYASDLPPNHGGDNPTATAPRLAELCFQTAGVFEIGTTGVMALPTSIGSVRYTSDAGAVDGDLHAVVEPTPDGFAARVVDGDGHTLVEMSGYRTTALPAGLDDELVGPLRDAME